MSTIEKLARDAWVSWGWEYAQWDVCDGCGEFRACRARRRSRFLCLECFDLSGGAR